MDYFTLFNLPQEHSIDLRQLQQNYQTLQQQHHPDRFTTATKSIQLQEMQKIVIVNDAYQTLKDPLRRAEYLLSLHGIELNSEQHTVKNIQFLSKQLMLREQLDEISQNIANNKLAAETDFHQFVAITESDIAEHYHELTQQLLQKEWMMAAETTRKIRFFSKLQEEIEKVEAKLFEF